MPQSIAWQFKSLLSFLNLTVVVFGNLGIQCHTIAWQFKSLLSFLNLTVVVFGNLGIQCHKALLGSSSPYCRF